MNSDVFEKNIGSLVRHAELPSDDAAKNRARVEFLRAAEPPPAARSWGLPSTAAALLIAILIYGTARRGAAPAPPKEAPFTKTAQDSTPTFVAIQGAGGDHFLKGTLKGTKGNN